MSAPAGSDSAKQIDGSWSCIPMCPLCPTLQIREIGGGGRWEAARNVLLGGARVRMIERTSCCATRRKSVARSGGSVRHVPALFTLAAAASVVPQLRDNAGHFARQSSWPSCCSVIRVARRFRLRLRFGRQGTVLGNLWFRRFMYENT